MRIPLAFPAAPYLGDHRIQGRPVLPAVEIMELLANAVKPVRPDIQTHLIQAASFDKFLPLGDTAAVEVWAELVSADGGGSIATLKSKRRGKRGIARTLTHADVHFGGAAAATNRFRLDGINGPEGDESPPPSPERIYAELVPFGPSYRNLETITVMGPAGVRARIAAPAIGGPFQLGSPFVLDAAFHAACVWGQRNAAVVAFPVGFDQRRIWQPCQADVVYDVGIRVREKHPSLLVFDMAIEHQGELCETITGIRMRDVSGGRLKPPDWILASPGSGAGA